MYYCCLMYILLYVVEYTNFIARGEHCHPTNPVELEVTQIRIELRKKAFETRTKPVDIVTTVILSSSHSDRANVGNLSVVK